MFTLLGISCYHPGLVKIKESSDIEVKLNEVEKLLKNAINLPWKVYNILVLVL